MAEAEMHRWSAKQKDVLAILKLEEAILEYLRKATVTASEKSVRTAHSMTCIELSYGKGEDLLVQYKRSVQPLPLKETPLTGINVTITGSYSEVKKAKAALKALSCNGVRLEETVDTLRRLKSQNDLEAMIQLGTELPLLNQVYGHKKVLKTLVRMKQYHIAELNEVYGSKLVKQVFRELKYTYKEPKVEPPSDPSSELVA